MTTGRHTILTESPLTKRSYSHRADQNQALALKPKTDSARRPSFSVPVYHEPAIEIPTKMAVVRNSAQRHPPTAINGCSIHCRKTPGFQATERDRTRVQS